MAANCPIKTGFYCVNYLISQEMRSRRPGPLGCLVASLGRPLGVKAHRPLALSPQRNPQNLHCSAGHNGGVEDERNYYIRNLQL